MQDMTFYPKQKMNYGKKMATCMWKKSMDKNKECIMIFDRRNVRLNKTHYPPLTTINKKRICGGN